jgi:hypothetical protein
MSDETINKEDVEKALFVNDAFTYDLELDLPIPKEDKTIKARFVFKEISGYEADKLTQGMTNVDAKTGKINIIQEEANIKYLKACLVKAPFEISDYNLKRLNKKVKDELLEFARKVNSIDKDIPDGETEKK